MQLSPTSKPKETEMRICSGGAVSTVVCGGWALSGGVLVRRWWVGWWSSITVVETSDGGGDRFVALIFFLFCFSLSVMLKLEIASSTCTVTGEEYAKFVDRFLIPSCYDPILYGSDRTALDALPVACRAYGGEPTLSLFRSLFALGHHPGTLSFPFPAEPYDVPLQSSLSRYPIKFWTFLEHILYLAGLACSWEGFPLHSAILIDGREMTLKDFLQFLGNHPVSVFVVPASAPLSVGSPNIVVGAMPVFAPVSLFPKGKEIMGSSAGGSKRKRLRFSVDRASSPVFLGGVSGDDEAQESHDILNGTMLNREAHSLSAEVLRLHSKVLDLKSQRSEFAATISKLEAKLLGVEVESSKKILESDTESLCGRYRQFEENEATMLATEAILKAELEVFKEKLDLANEDHSLMVTDLLPHVVKKLISSDSFSALLAYLQKKAMLVRRAQAFEEVIGMCISLQLEDVNDYDPDAADVYDKPIDNFYHVEFPYLDLLAYHSKKSLGLLKSLEPPFNLLHKSSGVGPSSSPFI
ncbi:hypothetical protein Tco_0640525 [Tanacetum coccineum]